MGLLIVPDLSKSRVRLKAHVALAVVGEALIFSDDKQAIITQGQATAARYFERLRMGVSCSGLALDPLTSIFSAVLTEMAALGWLTFRRNLEGQHDPALARNFGILDAWCNDEACDPLTSLQEAHVAIVGLGGVGAEIALHLVAAGLGRLTLVDGDNVEVSNLNRQYAYSRRDLGRPKHDALVTRLRDLRPDVDVHGFGIRIREPDDLELLDGADLVIQAADDLSVPLNLWVAAWADVRGIGYTTASIGIDAGYWGPFAMPKRTPPATTLLDRLAKTARDRRAMQQGTPWSLGATNSLVSAFAARDVIALLGGAADVPSLGRRMRVQFSSGSVSALDLRE